MPRPANGGGNGTGNGRRYDRDTSLAEEMLQCLHAADWIADQYGPGELSTEDLRSIAASLFIEYQRSGGGRRIMPERAKERRRDPAPPAPAPAGAPFGPDESDLPF